MKLLLRPSTLEARLGLIPGLLPALLLAMEGRFPLPAWLAVLADREERPLEPPEDLVELKLWLPPELERCEPEEE